MNKAINVAHDMHAVRTQSALAQLRLLYAGDTGELYSGTKVYRLAVARRFTVCYFAFLNFLLARIEVDYDVDSVGMEDVLHRCRRYNLFTTDDERMVIKMSMLYAALSYYGEGFDGESDDLLQDIPSMGDFVEQYIGCKTIMPAASPALEAVV